ncbi:MAG: spore coat U domain-containing protein [Comamonas sp.]
MKHALSCLRRGAIRWLLPLVAACALAAPAQAQSVSCSASMSPVSFGTLSPFSTSDTTTSATLNYSCNNTSNRAQQVNICFNIGDGAQSLGYFNPRRMTSGSSVLNMQLYYNGGSTIWGSNGNATVPSPPNLAFSIARNSSYSGSIPLTAKVFGGQNLAVPGTNYLDNFSGVHTSITYSFDTSTPSNCSGNANSGAFPFQVTATVPSYCQITTTSALNFGSQDGDNIATSASSTLGVQCTNTTPYQIGLTPANGNTGGQGRMLPTGTIPGNTDGVTYRLYRDSAGAQPWGSLLNSNTRSAIGSGNVDSYTVYGAITHQVVQPDSYKDTVTVTVTY